MYKLVSDFREKLSQGRVLCLMPIDRLRFDEQLDGPHGVICYPSESIDYRTLRVVSLPDLVLKDFFYREQTQDSGGLTSAFSAVDSAALQSFPVIAQAVDLNWSSFLGMSPSEHINLLQRLEGGFEQAMNLVRYYGARLDLPDALPGRSGLIPSSDGFFSIALLYNPADHESYIVAGRHLITAVIAGVGLELEDWAPYPHLNYGEVGSVVRCALSLYSRALEGSDNTIKFIQVLSLLEFLAMRGEYGGSDAVRQAVALHMGNTKKEYHQLSQRLRHLQGGAKAQDGRQIGYRTRVVHFGDRIEDILAPGESLSALFRELDRYVHSVMDFLISKETESWAKVEEWRESRKKAIGI